ncbi:hypothetical protein GGS21DRAFT_486682 [Xylaria nigripes]|nr:hypothetical protein GGS21DRAFT_486682 [Xylaria nigripes]
MTSSVQGSAPTLTASQITAGYADLLIGTWIYPCRHRFCWILDYHLPRAGPRAPDVHACPKCSEDPTCLVCLKPFDIAAESCANCEEFFIESLLPDRRARLDDLNIRVLDERADLCVRAQLENKRRRFRDKWGSSYEVMNATVKGNYRFPYVPLPYYMDTKTQ